MNNMFIFCNEYVYFLLFFPGEQAFSQAYSIQRKVAEDGETNEEALLQESASKEAYYMGRLLEQQTELRHTRSQASNTQAENERLGTILQDLREVGPSIKKRFYLLTSVAGI